MSNTLATVRVMVVTVSDVSGLRITLTSLLFTRKLHDKIKWYPTCIKEIKVSLTKACC